MSILDKGDILVATAIFTVHATGVRQNPTTVTFTVTSPAKVVTIFTQASLEVVNISTGVFQLTFDPSSESGIWFVNTESTGDAQAAEEVSFKVKTLLA